MNVCVSLKLCARRATEQDFCVFTPEIIQYLQIKLCMIVFYLGLKRGMVFKKKRHFARIIYQKGHIVSLRHLQETRQYITQSLKLQQVKLGKKKVCLFRVTLDDWLKK
jgi:hypothetical protein